MPIYTFTLTFKDKIGFFEKHILLNDIQQACKNYNQFIFGKNIKDIKNINIDDNKVHVKIILFSKISNEDFNDAVNNVIKILKNKKYKFQRKKKGGRKSQKNRKKKNNLTRKN